MVCDAVFVTLVSCMDAIGGLFELPASDWLLWCQNDQAFDHVVGSVGGDAGVDVHVMVGMIHVQDPVISVHSDEVAYWIGTLRFECCAEEVIAIFHVDFVFFQHGALNSLDGSLTDPLLESSLAVFFRRRLHLWQFGFLARCGVPRVR